MFKKKRKSLSRVFQALRIAVNDELGALEDLLIDSQFIVPSGGRMAVLSYHSLEDRRVKVRLSENVRTRTELEGVCSEGDEVWVTERGSGSRQLW